LAVLAGLTGFETRSNDVSDDLRLFEASLVLARIVEHRTARAARAAQAAAAAITTATCAEDQARGST
jgi:hypothetical protein